jgi:hypothetical protein
MPTALFLQGGVMNRGQGVLTWTGLLGASVKKV